MTRTAGRVFFPALLSLVALAAGGRPAAIAPRVSDAHAVAGPRAAHAYAGPAGPRRASIAGDQVTMGVAAVRIGRVRSGGGYDVARVPLEDYVSRVLAGEAAARSAPAALEALAVAVRTFAIANLARHKGEGFDLCDQTHCQVMAASTQATRAAAAATAGQILTYRGLAASIFYTACCGGRSELPSEVWPRAQDQPFLKRHKDRACGRLPEWTTEIASADLLHALTVAGFRGTAITNVRVGRRSDSGRAAIVKIDGLEPGEISGDDLRFAVGRALGSQLIKSTMFEVKRSPAGYRFTGRGFGHGIGLCAIGAARMAADGKSATKILEEYFPGTKIAQLPIVETTEDGPPIEPDRVAVPQPKADAIPRPAPFPSPSTPRPAAPPPVTGRVPVERPLAAPAPRTADGVRVDVVLPGNPRRAGDVQRLVRATLTEISRRTGAPLPADLEIVFHPTIESYSAQTKLPWWTAAAARDNRIDLLPLPLLEERHIFERTLRHEVAHVLTAQALAGRPVWVKEGAAIFLSGERVERAVSRAGDGRIACPTDDELLHSQSAAALHDAYTRAAACYGAQIAAGRRWDQVGAPGAR